MKHLLSALILTGIASGQTSLVGNWQGTLDTGAVKLRLVFHVTANEKGDLSATLDSLDQNMKGAPVKEASIRGTAVRFDIAGLRASYDGTLASDGMSMAGTFTQVRSMPLELRRVNAIEEPSRPQHPQGPFPYRTEEVVFQSRGSQLAGSLTIPSGQGPFPAVVLISGSGPQDRDGTIFSHKPFWVIADYLTRRGIAVLRVDDRGTGKSAGNSTTLTTDEMAGDVLAGLALLKSRPDMDGKRLGLIGHSEGGIVGPLATSRSKDVAFLVMLAGLGVPGEEVLFAQAAGLARAAGASEDSIAQNRAIQGVFFKVLREETEPTASLAKLNTEFQAMKAALLPAQRAALDASGFEATLARRFQSTNTPEVRSIVLANPAETLRQIKIPVLALNGALDAQVPAAANLAGITAALTAAGNSDFTVTALPGLNHLFQTCKTCQPAEYGGLEETFSPAALAIMGDWIVRHTAPTR